MAHDGGPHALSDYEVERLAEHLDAVLEGLLAREDDEAAAAVVGLLEGLERIHAEGLRRMAELVARDPEQLRRALRDPVISSLFELYQLSLPDPGPPSAPGVPDLIDPGGVSPTGDVSVLPQEKLVQLRSRLSGSETGMETAPDGSRVGRIALDQLDTERPSGLTIGRTSVLVLRAGDQVYAFRNVCPGTPLPLHTGELSDGVLTCPWHGCRFDSVTGDRLNDGGPPLTPLTAGIAGREVIIAL